ncbi:MAG: TrbI/VirB10 family protein [Pseudomonadota bacterium]
MLRRSQGLWPGSDRPAGPRGARAPAGLGINGQDRSSQVEGHLRGAGQSRALIVWNRLIMPDGSSIRIDNLPAVDGRGNAGLRDRVNNHSLRIFSAAALTSLISIGAELGDDDDDRIARALRDATQDGAQTVAQQVIQRQLNVQPTVTIRRGWRLRLLVHQNIILRPYGEN